MIEDPAYSGGANQTLGSSGDRCNIFKRCFFGVKGVLNNLGFINFDKVVASQDIKPKDVDQKKFLNNDVVKKPKAEKKITQQQQSEIDQIKEMFNIGALTKDEYNAAVERVLK